MMKLGCMSLSYQKEFSAGELDLEGFIDRAHKLRLDGIDIHTGAFAQENIYTIFFIHTFIQSCTFIFKIKFFFRDINSIYIPTLAGDQHRIHKRF